MNLNRHLLAIFALAAVSCSILPAQDEYDESAAAADSSEVAVSGALNLNFASKYIFRGVIVNDEPVFWPDASVGIGSDATGTLTASIWANMDLGDEFDNQGEFTEYDLILDYTKAIDIVSMSIGAIRYDFPNTELAHTTEVYGSVGLDVPLAPTFTAYYDVREVEGWYLNGSIGHSFEVSESVSLDLGLSAGWMDEDQAAGYFGASDSGFSDITASAGLGFAINENTSASLSLNAVTVPDGDLRDTQDEPDNIYAVAGIGFSF